MRKFYFPSLQDYLISSTMMPVNTVFIQSMLTCLKSRHGGLFISRLRLRLCFERSQEAIDHSAFRKLKFVPQVLDEYFAKRNLWRTYNLCPNFCLAKTLHDLSSPPTEYL